MHTWKYAIMCDTYNTCNRKHIYFWISGSQDQYVLRTNNPSCLPCTLKSISALEIPTVRSIQQPSKSEETTTIIWNRPSNVQLARYELKRIKKQNIEDLIPEEIKSKPKECQQFKKKLEEKNPAKLLTCFTA